MSGLVLRSDADGGRSRTVGEKHGSWLSAAWRREQQSQLGEEERGREVPHLPEETLCLPSQGNLRTLVAAAVSLGSGDVFG